MKFKLEIELGNDAMRTRKHLVGALKEVIRQLKNPEKKEYARIRDINGNSVGQWELEGK